MDVELFEIAMKHMKAAENEMDQVIAARLKKDDGVVQHDDSSDEEVEVNTDKGQVTNSVVQSDGEALRNNKYGASGSSAAYSDTEILNMKAPALKRIRGRERCKRFMAGSEKSKKKWKKNNKKNKNTDGIEPAESVAKLRPVQNSVGTGSEADATVNGQNQSNKNSKGVEDGDTLTDGKLYFCGKKTLCS